MRLSEFLREHASDILARRSAGPVRIPDPTLRDVLLALAEALERPQDEVRSNLGQALACTDEPLTVAELAAEMASLRTSVLTAWAEAASGEGALRDAAQFCRALDQLLLDAMLAFGQRLDEAMNRSLAVIGHDLRNSLGAISMSSSLLSRAGSLPEELRKPAGGILSTVARMKHMVNDLEDLARVRLGKGMPIVRASVDLQPILAAAIKELQDLNADFSIEFFCGGDLKGSWDAARLAQALANLVRHAVQYGSFREPVRVSAEGLAEEVLLSVTNRGLPEPLHPLRMGIDPMLVQRAEDSDARTGAGGFRLGLSIAAAIAAAHGGTLEIAGTSAGTALVLRLPRR